MKRRFTDIPKTVVWDGISTTHVSESRDCGWPLACVFKVMLYAGSHAPGYVRHGWVTPWIIYRLGFWLNSRSPRTVADAFGANMWEKLIIPYFVRWTPIIVVVALNNWLYFRYMYVADFAIYKTISKQIHVSQGNGSKLWLHCLQKGLDEVNESWKILVITKNSHI